MASFSVDTSGVFDIEKLLNTDKVSIEMLESASPLLVDEMRKNALKRSGAESKSIKATKPKRNAYGYATVIRPTGKDKKGVRNAEKMVYSEYGTSKQTAKPIISKSVKAVEEKVLNKMQNIYNKNVE